MRVVVGFSTTKNCGKPGQQNEDIAESVGPEASFDSLKVDVSPVSIS